MNRNSWLIGCSLSVAILLVGCAASDIKPVDLFPEDQCAQCRMAVSTEVFASEIIAKDGNVFKFDDLGCQERFLNDNKGIEIAAIFVKDYHTRAWLAKEKSVIVRTSLKTPMGSGKVAVADSVQAKQLVEKYPAQELAETEGCSCCKVDGNE